MKVMISEQLPSCRGLEESVIEPSVSRLPGSRSRSKTAQVFQQDLSGLSGLGGLGVFFWKNRSNRSNLA